MDLKQAREEIKELDQEILKLAAKRVQVARHVAEYKHSQAQPTVDFLQEKSVQQEGRRVADEAGLDHGVAEDLLDRLIQASVTIQETSRLEASSVGEGQKAVVVGGAGRMGVWFTRFLQAHGFHVRRIDPKLDADESEEGRSHLKDADLVLCATPPGRTADLYEQWVHDLPGGVICDIASIKSPLLEPMGWLREAGASLASIHPMFGPETRSLRNEDVVVCDTGDEEATSLVESLFEHTTATIHHMPLEQHDHAMADLLGLAHATAIAFAASLPRNAYPVGSTTYTALEKVALAVVEENPEVYFEIQADNPHAASATRRLRRALDQIHRVVELRDQEAFQRLMQSGRERLMHHMEAREVDA